MQNIKHIANWLHHNLVSENQVRDAMKKMALVVDEQITQILI